MEARSSVHGRGWWRRLWEPTAAWLRPTGVRTAMGTAGLFTDATQVSVSGQMDKQYMVCVYNGIVFSLEKARDADTH